MDGGKRKVKQISLLEHAKKKSMWAGSKEMQTIETYVLEQECFKLEELKYPPALLKIIDEVIVNALDHFVHNPKTVTEINVKFDNGTISVYNNGPGISIEKTKNINGVEMYIPQMIASEFLAGDNIDDTGDNIKGGTNGVGLKLANAFSNIMILETIDNGFLYKQVFKNGLTIIEPPSITKTKEKPYTRITFEPNYKEFNIDSTFYPTLDKLLTTRSYQGAVYVKAKFKYNDVLIDIPSFNSFCRMFTCNEVLTTTINAEYVWDVGFAISDGKECQLSIVNGVHMPKGGTHILHIQKLLVENLKEYVEKEIKKAGVKFNKNYILNNVHIFMKGSIPSPQFLSQTKEAISDPIEKFKNYKIPETFYKKLWDLLAPAILDSFLKTQIGSTKTRTNRSKIDVPKYKEAKFCRDAKECLKCGLIITEGDSASGTADTGLLDKATPEFTYDYYGVFGIQGVMMNGLKESLEVINKGTVKRIPKKKINDNDRISCLIKVLGLDFNKTYEDDKEFKTLRYGFLVGLMDQDLDGFNIFGLLSTFIMTYWPALVKKGFIRRINTPVIRAYPTSKKDFVKEFYSEKEAKIWMDSLDEKTLAKYKIQYYKGLGTHRQSFKEVTQMFKNIDSKIVTYILDENAIKTMFIYYGTETSDRKQALSFPVNKDYSDKKNIPISEHFEIDSKSFQRDNIIRKLLNLVDGFVSSRRKVFYTIRKHGNGEIKVQGLAGKVVADANYHHGEASLESTITRMAQGYPMARNLPLLLPLGQYGTRSKGYKDYASSRYIYTKVNNKLADKLFRKEDEFILEYEIEDGKRYEPKYYVPIIPYVLCETNELPATGWAINIQARDIDHIIKNLRLMINGEISHCKPLPMWNRCFKGSIRKYNGRNYSVGNYDYDPKKRIVHITELPLGVFSNTYLKGSDDEKDKEDKKGIQTKEFIDDFDDDTTMDGVDIKLYLKEGAFEKISSDNSKYGIVDKQGNAIFDCFEDYFELRAPIYDRINLVNEKGEVVEYDTYEKVFDDWFVYRKNLYAVRIEREIILCKLNIKMLENIQRFSKNHDTYKITNKTTEEMANKIFEDNSYDKFNHSVLESPKFTNVSELIKLITETDASYDYLLKLSYRDLTYINFNKRDEKIKEYKERVKYLEDETGKFKGSKIWLKELDELDAAIKQGLTSEWFYGENEVKFE